MKISKETLATLKCLSTINPNLLIKPGSQLLSKSPQRTVVAEMSVSETFPSDFGIYDLSEFLGTFSLVEDADIEFKSKYAVISNSKSSIKFYSADPSILIVQDTPLKYPGSDVIEFDLTSTTLTSLIKAAGVLRSTDVAFVGDGKKCSIQVRDVTNPTANSFTMELCDNDKVFNANFKIENFKMPIDDYTVGISSKKISKFKSVTLDTIVYVALEATSTL
jgi:hypothetical protein